MRILGVFLKYWQPGRVKTRLACELGPGQACAVYEALVRHLFSRFRNTGDSRWLVVTPSSCRHVIAAAAGPGWRTHDQGEGDLGARLSRFSRSVFDGSLRAGNSVKEKETRLVVIGGDCPQLDPELVEEAFDQLRSVPLVLGPATDGGYYLVGVNGSYPVLFEEIDWGTGRVFQQTLERAKQAGLAWRTLRELRDVDTWADLISVQRQLGESSEPASRLLASRLAGLTERIV